ncbi:hypothetical protein PENTCL1PPCAC_5558, partial [Pristionchus entomophagus]
RIMSYNAFYNATDYSWLQRVTQLQQTGATSTTAAKTIERMLHAARDANENARAALLNEMVQMTQEMFDELKKQWDNKSEMEKKNEFWAAVSMIFGLAEQKEFKALLGYAEGRNLLNSVQGMMDSLVKQAKEDEEKKMREEEIENRKREQEEKHAYGRGYMYEEE